MPIYQKAYELGRLREFIGWAEKRPSGAADLLPTDTLVFLHQDLSVRVNAFGDPEILFDGHHPEWPRFCREVLQFAVPDWEAESRRVRERLMAEGHIMPGQTK